MNADGSGKRNLTRNPAYDGRPCLVARRAEDRLRQQPRRQLRGLRHERRRERAAESGATQPVTHWSARCSTADGVLDPVGGQTAHLGQRPLLELDFERRKHRGQRTTRSESRPLRHSRPATVACTHSSFCAHQLRNRERG